VNLCQNYELLIILNKINNNNYYYWIIEVTLSRIKKLRTCASWVSNLSWLSYLFEKISACSNFLPVHFLFQKTPLYIKCSWTCTHMMMMIMLKIELTMDNQKEASAQQQVPLPHVAEAHPTPDFLFSSTTQMCLRILLINLLRVCERLLHLDRIVGLEQSHPINLK